MSRLPLPLSPVDRTFVSPKFAGVVGSAPTVVVTVTVGTVYVTVLHLLAAATVVTGTPFTVIVWAGIVAHAETVPVVSPTAQAPATPRPNRRTSAGSTTRQVMNLRIVSPPTGRGLELAARAVNITSAVRVKHREGNGDLRVGGHRDVGGERPRRRLRGRQPDHLNRPRRAPTPAAMARPNSDLTR